MILVYDIGTSLIKGALFDHNAVIIDHFEVPVALLENEDPLLHEQDPEAWINSIKEINKRIVNSLHGNIDGVVISGNGPTLLPAGVDGKPLTTAISWMDSRCSAESDIIKEITGSYIDSTFYLPKAYWLFKHRPDIYEKTEYFFSCPEYINFLLTGNAATILPGKHFLKYFWTDDILNRLSLDPGRFPGFIKPGSMVGRVTEKGMSLFGLKAGIPVIAGGPDFIMSILGTGTISPGQACDRAGTSEGINLCSERMIADNRLLSYGHIIDDYYNISGIISTTGKALEWFKNITGREKLNYNRIFKDIFGIPAGSGKLIFLPYLAGERAPIWDDNARGSFIGLTVNHGLNEMTHAVLESVGYAIRHVIEVMEENGVSMQELRITGSPAKSPLWNQIKANITGKRILVPLLTDSELLGDLCLALYGLGEYDNLAAAAAEMVKIKDVYYPDPGSEKVYGDYFQLYKDAYVSLKDLFRDLSGIR